MFTLRLRWLVVLFAALGLIIVARLVELQVVAAGEFQALAARLLTQPVRYVAAPRGAILDRNGRVLVADEPSADICVHYAALRGRSDYFTALARETRRRGDFPADMPVSEVVVRLRAQLRETWSALAALTGRDVDEIIARAEQLGRRVERIREAVQRRNPDVVAIPEENQLLPVVHRIDNATAVRARLELERFPWVRVVPSSRRQVRSADALAHVLGRLGAPSAAQIEEDIFADDELRRLSRIDRVGASGIERMAEASLRGTSGRVVEDLNRRELERIDPRPGHDVYLTIDAVVQERTLAILEEVVADCVHPAGAAAVVLDLRTREVLALASYPTYSLESFNRDYDTLRRDTRRLPLLARALAGQYPPGSTCKAITLMAGLAEGVITPGTHFDCTGHYLPDNTSAFRCWIYNQSPGATHGSGLSCEEAIKHSCNIYFFHTGDRLGAGRLCDWFERFGLGRSQGTRLIEEAAGIVPSDDWLQRVARRERQPADAWNYAIGQGEVTITPLQAANVAATIATGYWQPVCLAYDATGRALGEEKQTPRHLPEGPLRVLRAGMWRVVNESGGTADKARLDTPGWTLSGKTGSAQASPRVVSYRYTLDWPDGKSETVVASSREDALAWARQRRRERLTEQRTGAAATRPVAAGEFDEWSDVPDAVRPEEPLEAGEPVIRTQQIEERFPEMLEGERFPTHAWFIGYALPAEPRRAGRARERVAPGRERPGDEGYAISILIEYGGGGGRIAGPVAKRVIEAVLER